MNIVCCQLNTVWEDKGANFERVRALLAAQPIPPGALVVLPEMFATGFSMNVAGIAEAAKGNDALTPAFLADTARAYQACVVGGVVTREPSGRGRNEAVVVGPDGAPIARYQKLHPFTYGGEAAHYAPGEQIVVFSWQNALVAPFICYDLRFPEAFRAAAHRGAQVLVVIANWPVARAEHWVTLLRARAIENQAYVVGVNRCGSDPALRYPGRSLVVSPHGEIVSDAGADEGVTVTCLDLPDQLAYRGEFGFLDDIHPRWRRDAE